MNPASIIIQALFLHLRKKKKNLEKKREKKPTKKYFKHHPFAQSH